jgi:4-hydroxy-3-methylbut-2-enyl diphosphate reductase
MTKIITGYIPKNSGFCFGVSLAVETAYAKNQTGKLYMFGEVVHNPEVIANLRKKNIEIINSVEDLKKINVDVKNTKILIRAHGVPKKTFESLKNNGFEIIDRTCPKVRRVQKIVNDAYKAGKRILIIGNPGHPEVIGINGWCNFSAVIAEDIKILQNAVLNTRLQKNEDFCMVSQTTYDLEKYKKIYKFYKKTFKNIEYHNTICTDTSERQKTIRRISSLVDMVIIVGGKTSSNSTRLSEIASENCKHVQHIENPQEINLADFDKISAFAICGGTSTPKENINSLVEHIKHYFNNSDALVPRVQVKIVTCSL